MAKARIGHKMNQVANFVRANDGCMMVDAAREVGPHGSTRYGYQAVHRAVNAGLVVCRPGKRRGTYTLHVKG